MVVVIRVGGATEVEVKEKKDLIGDALKAWKVAAHGRTIRQNTNFSGNPTYLKAAACVRPCRVFGANRTKMFHVKLFGKIDRQAPKAAPPRST
jgi:chaperonin GroEL (HSP60 family)